MEAYCFFTENIGFEVYNSIVSFTNQLKHKYDDVFIIGFSVGATIAWRCCENALFSGIVACDGSRIRDYTDLPPACPTLLVFSKEESFDVHALAYQLREKQLLSIIEFDAIHGFLDFFSKNYAAPQAKCAEETITRFLNECNK